MCAASNIEALLVVAGIGTLEKLPLGPSNKVSSIGQENELVDYILEMEVKFYGISIQEVRHLAFQLAERNKIPHDFNRDAQMAGWDWNYAFMRRHPKLSLRSPEATSAARAQGFNKIAVNAFYDILECHINTEKFSPSSVYNVDETSVVAVSFFDLFNIVFYLLFLMLL